MPWSPKFRKVKHHKKQAKVYTQAVNHYSTGFELYDVDESVLSVAETFRNMSLLKEKKIEYGKDTLLHGIISIMKHLQCAFEETNTLKEHDEIRKPFCKGVKIKEVFEQEP